MAKKTYGVLVPIEHNKKLYAPDGKLNTIDLEEDSDEAAQLLQVKAIAEPAEEPAAAPAKPAAKK